MVGLIPQRVHFVGIGGSGMSSLGRVLLEKGVRVSGSDIKRTGITEELARMGAVICYGHAAENLGDAEMVVVSSAIPPDNVEVIAARKRSIPIIHRADMLAWLMRLQHGIAVAGAHGKTTTTALVALVLEKAGFDPTVVIGGEANHLGSGARAGSGTYLVAEADESDGSFLKLSPRIAVVTNVEADHFDYYGTFERVCEAFHDFLRRLPGDGLAVLCVDDPFLATLANRLKVPVCTYGENSGADYVLRSVSLNGTGSQGEVWWRGEKLGTLRVSVPGVHNLKNALAAVAVGRHLELDFATITRVLVSFRGVKRRFQLLGEAGGIKVIDDYAHHPTEIKATLRAARQIGPRRVVAVFQPHRYTRTYFLYDAFGEALSGADVVLINAIYPAGEKAIPGVDARLIVRALQSRGIRPYYCPTQDEVVETLARITRAGDVVLVLGAGDIWQSGVRFVETLEAAAR
ncbi:MAG: UDP-N-acetylmuramate--L-alanine ligase [Desulfotomaculales bacterium]